jgi:hypothetical protein
MMSFDYSFHERRQFYSEFNLPVTKLWINPFHNTEAFFLFEFNEVLLSSVRKIIVDLDKVSSTYDSLRHLSKLKNFKNLQTVFYISVNNIDLSYLGDFIRDIAEMSPIFSLFHRKWDEESICVFEMEDETVFAKTEASLILFKCNNFHLFQKSNKRNLHLNKNGIYIWYNAIFNILDIQNVKIYTKEDYKDDELLAMYFDLGGV